MKKVIGFMFIMLGIMFTTDVFADIGTISENCKSEIIDVGESSAICFEIVKDQTMETLAMAVDEYTCYNKYSVNEENEKYFSSVGITDNYWQNIDKPPADNRNGWTYNVITANTDINTCSTMNLNIHRCQYLK